tara:strand:- start:1350 stop:1514 length:165 start_codon:yes stop_codon:yes gene_type:complete
MKIQDMTRAKLEEEIRLAQKKLNSPAWVRNNRRWWVGVVVRNLGKLEEELRSRD